VECDDVSIKSAGFSMEMSTVLDSDSWMVTKLGQEKNFFMPGK